MNKESCPLTALIYSINNFLETCYTAGSYEDSILIVDQIIHIFAVDYYSCFHFFKCFLYALLSYASLYFHGISFLATHPCDAVCRNTSFYTDVFASEVPKHA